MKTKHRILAVLILAAIAIGMFPGCAADGSFDPVAFSKAVDTSVGTYERIRYGPPAYHPNHLTPVVP